MCNAAVSCLRLRRRLLVSLCVGVLLFWTAVASTACASVAPVVKIGLVAPFEGAQRAIGYDVIFSARMAVQEINAAGGINGIRVALVALDDRGNAKLASDAAAALVIDPGVVAVVGHWQPETTTIAAAHYAAAGMPFLSMADTAITQFPPTELPLEFQDRYIAIAPFNESPGSYAGPAYDAFQMLWEAFRLAEQNTGRISREDITASWYGLEYQGLTGAFARPLAGDR